MMKYIERVQQGASEASPPACNNNNYLSSPCNAVHGSYYPETVMILILYAPSACMIDYVGMAWATGIEGHGPTAQC